MWFCWLGLPRLVHRKTCVRSFWSRRDILYWWRLELRQWLQKGSDPKASMRPHYYIWRADWPAKTTWPRVGNYVQGCEAGPFISFPCGAKGSVGQSGQTDCFGDPLLTIVGVMKVVSLKVLGVTSHKYLHLRRFFDAWFWLLRSLAP